MKPTPIRRAATELGRSLLVPLAGLIDWADAHFAAVRKARKAFDGALKEAF